MKTLETATDADLIELFSMDDAGQLITSAFRDHRGFLQHETCSGTWQKWPSDTVWKFYPFSDE